MKAKRVKKDRSATIVPEVVDGGTYSDLVGAIGELLERARERIATTANTALVETYWNTGRYIVEYEQHGADRAKYGSRLLSTLARDLTLKHGSGFNRNNLQYMRKLYRAFPICTTLSCKLSWSHYLEILKCSDELEIGFYVAECARSNWNVRELRRQMKSSRDMIEYGDVGQMNMYLNYFKSEEGTQSDAAPIGIVLGAKKDDLVVQFATEGITNRIFVSRYQLYLPDKEQLRRELAYAIEAEEGRHVARQSAKRKGGGK